MQGALGAAASEVANTQMKKYLVKHGINPYSEEGKSLMNLASGMVGVAAGGGAGAVTAMDGEKYNQQLHPDVLNKLLSMVPAFAKQQGISEKEASDRLLLEAMRLQSTGWDAAMSTDLIGTDDKGIADDNEARSFLSVHKDFTTDTLLFGLFGQKEDIFHPEAPNNDQVNAYKLYSYLNEHPGAAKAYYDAQVYGTSQRGWMNTDATQKEKLFDLADADYVNNGYLAQDITSQSEKEFLEFEGRIILIGASGGLLEGVAGAGLIANMAGGGRTGSIIQFLLTSRTGTALTSGLVNAADQKIESGHVNWVDVGASTAGGWAGYGRGALWNTGVGFVTGAADTEANNIIYGKDDSVWGGASFSALGSGIGYGAGQRTEGFMNKWNPGSMSNTVTGNVVGTMASDTIDVTVEDMQKKVNKDDCNNSTNDLGGCR